MLELILNGIMTGSLYGLVALGIILVHKCTGVVNLAHGEMAMVSTFVVYTLLKADGINCPYWAAILLALLFSAVMGSVLERLFIKPLLSSLNVETTIMITLALYKVIGVAAAQIWSSDPIVFPSPFPKESISVVGIFLFLPSLGAFGVTVVLSLGFFVFFKFTKLGTAMRATADNPEAARLMGIDSRTVSTLSWMIASLLGASAGVLIAPLIFLDNTFMQPILILALIAGVLGGFYSLPGALVGGIVLGISQNLFGRYISGEFKSIFVFSLLFLILLIRPRGILGEAQERRV